MFRKTVICAIAAIMPLAGLADSANVKWPDCYCTDSAGARIELGETVCLTVDGRTYQARCEMMLNNPMWREVGSGCTVSLRSGPRSHPNTGAPLVQTANG